MYLEGMKKGGAMAAADYMSVRKKIQADPNYLTPFCFSWFVGPILVARLEDSED
jgi:hypothetical protein